MFIISNSILNELRKEKDMFKSIFHTRIVFTMIVISLLTIFNYLFSFRPNVWICSYSGQVREASNKNQLWCQRGRSCLHLQQQRHPRQLPRCLQVHLQWCNGLFKVKTKEVSMNKQQNSKPSTNLSNKADSDVIKTCMSEAARFIQNKLSFILEMISILL